MFILFLFQKKKKKDKPVSETCINAAKWDMGEVM